MSTAQRQVQFLTQIVSTLRTDTEGLSKSSVSITIPEDVTVPNTTIWTQIINHDPSNKPPKQDDRRRSN